ncbi:hypothetical protein QFC21_003895 [Naganishia friedmannii]|uniref:Uncharacterized protein n=1 Tax=Naganishia friedmannii TaxID=89922 RepID=A0ACC2VLE3_9TREE|nr:hypothetical protein QFC21_003895 [Naganishia friedmannii]
MRVTISPSKHAYFAGETLHVRIEFDAQERQPKRGGSVETVYGKAGGNGKVARGRLGIIGAGAFAAEKEHTSSTPGPPPGSPSSADVESGNENSSGNTTPVPYTGRATHQPVAPVPVPVVVIPQHHPHARKVSVAQVPTPPSLLASPHTEEGKADGSVAEGKAEGQGAVTPSLWFRSPLATITESQHPSTSPPAPRISTATTTHPIITFATIQMTGQMTPSTAYIPPEPLIPLRNLLLLQPIGSNGSSLAPPPTPTSSSSADPTYHFAPRHFSPTSAIDNAAADGTLTSSLTSLARGLFSPVTAGGAAEGEGTWEDHRKQVWLSRELPVWISPKDVVCVDTQVDSSGKISYTYAIPIPAHLPPTFKGKALSFGYTLRLSLSVTFPATCTHDTTTTKGSSGAKTPDEGKPSSSMMMSPLSALSSSSTTAWKLFSPVRAFNRAQLPNVDQQTPPPRVVQRELVVPVRVLPRITVPPTGESYDLLLPVIPRISSASVKRISAEGSDEPRNGTRIAASANKKSSEGTSEKGSEKENEEGFLRFVRETLKELHGPSEFQTATLVNGQGHVLKGRKEASVAASSTTEGKVEDEALGRAPAVALERNSLVEKQEQEVDSARMNTRFGTSIDPQKEESGPHTPGDDGEDADNEQLVERCGICSINGAPVTPTPPPIPTPASPPPPLSAGRLHAMMTERLSGTEAIQALIRSSRPGRFEIVKKHQQIAILSLPRVAWRTGEAVHGVVEFHDSVSRFDVLKLSIDLVTTETIPQPLLPHSANHSAPTQPLLQRTVAQYGNAYTLDLARTGFALGIPADATPAFQICAGNAAGETGGLTWGLHLRFLVRERAGERRKQGSALKRVDGRVDEVGYQRSGMTGELIQQDKPPDLELDVDIVECSIPLTVYPNDRGKPHQREFRL